MIRLGTIAEDSVTNISRNRVCDSKERDQGELAKLSAIISKKLSNTSSSKVLTVRDHPFTFFRGKG